MQVNKNEEEYFRMGPAIDEMLEHFAINLKEDSKPFSDSDSYDDNKMSGTEPVNECERPIN
jgi:hypothetical protein